MLVWGIKFGGFFMNVSLRFHLLGAAALAAVLAWPVVAFAAHGKPGLWKITVTMEGAGQNMPHISASDRAQMKAMGVEMPNDHTISTQHCMTEAEVNGNGLSALRQPAGSGCTLTNKTANGGTFSADMVCTGTMKGQGHVMISYDGAEHYTGKTSFTGTTQGQTTQMTTLLDGHWVSPDCGND